MNFPIIGRFDIKTAIVTVIILMWVLPFVLSKVGARKNSAA